METKIVFCEEQKDFDNVNVLLGGEWVLNPVLKIARLDAAVVYHLVKYSEEELKAGEEKEERFKIVSLKSVEINDADGMLAKGYEVLDSKDKVYAKTMILVKRERI